MHRTEGDGYVVDSGTGTQRFDPGNPLIPTPATQLTYDWCNAVQEELCAVVVGLGGTVNTAATDTFPQNQLWTRMNLKLGRLDLAQSWAGAQTFAGGVAGNPVFSGNVSVGGTLGVTGTTTLSGPANLNGTTTINGAASATAGLAVTNGTTNGNGVTATGNGTGSGVRAVGGASGVGVSASGGILGTSATIGASTLNYSPVYNYINSAVSSTNANQHPLWSLQTSTGAGQVLGLTTLTKNTAAVTDWMNVDVGFSYDVGAEGSAVRGAGGQLWFSTMGLKVYRWLSNPSTAATPVPAMTLMNGHLAFDSAVPAPNSTVAVKNAVTPGNTTKAHGHIIITSGSVSVDGGFNVASAAVSGTDLVITFAQAFVDTHYSFVPWLDNGKNCQRITKANGSFTIRMVDSSGATVSFASATVQVDFWASGAQ